MQIVGYALLSNDGHIVDILRLAIVVGHQGNGWGKLLLRRALLEHDIHHHVLCVRRNNHRAISMYLQHDFRITGMGDCSWFMERIIPRI
jgi:ribosomal protein S18 acetylase RimI-like enzyme